MLFSRDAGCEFRPVQCLFPRHAGNSLDANATLKLKSATASRPALTARNCTRGYVSTTTGIVASPALDHFCALRLIHQLIFPQPSI